MYFNLDSAGQLKSEVKTGSVNQADLYWYDASGNRTLKNEYRPNAEGNLTSKFITSTYNEMNQLVESVDSEGEEKYYYYDTWGNLISDGIAHYYYDHLNRLKEYRPFGVVDGTHYTYYIDNLRKSKDDTYFIWLDGNMVYEFTDDDSNTYTYGHRLISSDDAKYVLNAHGDVVVLLKDVEYEDVWYEEDGNNLYVTYTVTEVVKRYDYDAFGNELNIDNTDTNPFRYCAEYFDVESEQIYLRARYYSPVIGRFTQLDPIKDGLNWYAYCWNNPVIYIDTNGMYYIRQDCSYWTGTPIQSYTVYKETAFTLLPKSLVGLIDKGNLVTFGAEKLFYVVGGESSSSLTNILNDKANSLIVDQLPKKLGKIAHGLGTLSSIKEFASGIYQIELDKTTFELFERNNFTPRFSSAGKADQTMKNMQKFIENNSNYFLNENIGGYSLYWLDKKISNSKDPQETINAYAASIFGRNYMISNISLNEFKDFLGQYNNRLNQMDEYTIQIIFQSGGTYEG